MMPLLLLSLRCAVSVPADVSLVGVHERACWYRHVQKVARLSQGLESVAVSPLCERTCTDQGAVRNSVYLSSIYILLALHPIYCDTVSP